GDVANKVGTYPLALAAKAAKVPFVVVAPMSTLDARVPDGAHIAIEERDPSEVTSVLGTPVAPFGTSAVNPAFDVTPADLITAIVTEKGVARAPFERSLRAFVFGERAGRVSRKPKPAARRPAAKKAPSKKNPAKVRSSRSGVA